VGRHDRKHSDALKAAVVAAYEEQGLTAEQIITLAAAGQLRAAGKRERLRPVEIAESTIRNYVHLHRRRLRRTASNGAHDLEDDGPVPNEQVTVLDEPDTDTLLGELLGSEADFEQAVAEGRTCHCDDPAPHKYAWRDHTQCLRCREPAPD
jgi:hypothetical protein